VNFYYAFILLSKVYYEILKYNPVKLFTGLPKEFPSFFRTSMIIIFARLFKTKVYGELAGTSFPFIENKSFLLNRFSLYIFKNIYSIRFLANNIKNNYSYLKCSEKIVFDNGIYLPADYSVSDETIFSEKIKMVYVGSLEYHKGILTIINSLRLCRDNDIKFEFNFLGEWTNEKDKMQIENLINDYGLSKNIRFFGLKTGREKWEVFSSNAVLVHPTYWDGQPITILEAMGLGLAVISTRIGAIPETVKNEFNGLILDENTPYNLFYAIKRFYFDRDFVRQISENNKNTFKDRFTVEKYLNNFQDWIEK
jgi:glycosyltransferase involved in cell wall biosynthesis